MLCKGFKKVAIMLSFFSLSHFLPVTDTSIQSGKITCFASLGNFVSQIKSCTEKKFPGPVFVELELFVELGPYS